MVSIWSQIISISLTNSNMSEEKHIFFVHNGHRTKENWGFLVKYKWNHTITHIPLILNHALRMSLGWEARHTAL